MNERVDPDSTTAGLIAPAFPTGFGKSDTHAMILSSGAPNPSPSAGKPYSMITGRGILKLLSEPPSVPKMGAQWFIPSDYAASDARSHEAQRSRGMFWVLPVDIDKNDLALADVLETIEIVAPGARMLGYSSRSATARDRKSRVLLPLAQGIPGADYADTVNAYYDLIEDAGGGVVIPDRALAGPGQLIFLPNRGEFYESKFVRASRLALTADHPIIVRREAKRAERAAAEREVRRAREEKARRAEARTVPGEQTPVEHFNARHEIDALLARYGYAQLGGSNDWRSPFQTSGSFATRDYGEYWTSLSGSDAAEGIGALTESGHRHGDAFDLFVHFEHGGDFTEAVRAYAEEAGIGNDRDTVGGPNFDWNTRREAEQETRSTGPDERATGDSDGSSSDERADKTASEGRSDILSATPFIWRDPLSLAPRPWLYGRHLLRRQVSVTVAAPGVGKSSLTIVEALAMTTARNLLEEWVARPLRVWLFNLEDPRDELERRVIAAMTHHGIQPADIGDRLFVDSGRERGICTAIQTRKGVVIVRPEVDAIIAEIRAKQIDVLTVDPFVSSHQAGENDNNAIDLVAKEWARIADACDCAIELVHHTGKTNGVEASTEDGRGASALLAAARSGRVLNKMSDELKEEAGVGSDPATYFAVTRDKANLAPAGKRVWRRMASVELGQGDNVGVAEVWHWPDTFEGMTTGDLLKVQQAIDGKHPRFSDQSGDDWAGHIVADVLGLNGVADRVRIKKMIADWVKSGALRKVSVNDETRRPRPCLEVGEWATA